MDPKNLENRLEDMQLENELKSMSEKEKNAYKAAFRAVEDFYVENITDLKKVNSWLPFGKSRKAKKQVRENLTERLKEMGYSDIPIQMDYDKEVLETAMQTSDNLVKRLLKGDKIKRSLTLKQEARQENANSALMNYIGEELDRKKGLEKTRRKKQRKAQLKKDRANSPVNIGNWFTRKLKKVSYAALPAIFALGAAVTCNPAKVKNAKVKKAGDASVDGINNANIEYVWGMPTNVKLSSQRPADKKSGSDYRIGVKLEPLKEVQSTIDGPEGSMSDLYQRLVQYQKDIVDGEVEVAPKSRFMTESGYTPNRHTVLHALATDLGQRKWSYKRLHENAEMFNINVNAFAFPFGKDNRLTPISPEDLGKKPSEEQMVALNSYLNNQAPSKEDIKDIKKGLEEYAQTPTRSPSQKRHETVPGTPTTPKKQEKSTQENSKVETVYVVPVKRPVVPVKRPKDDYQKKPEPKETPQARKTPKTEESKKQQQPEKKKNLSIYVVRPNENGEASGVIKTLPEEKKTEVKKDKKGGLEAKVSKAEKLQERAKNIASQYEFWKDQADWISGPYMRDGKNYSLYSIVQRVCKAPTNPESKASCLRAIGSAERIISGTERKLYRLETEHKKLKKEAEKHGIKVPELKKSYKNLKKLKKNVQRFRNDVDIVSEYMSTRKNRSTVAKIKNKYGSKAFRDTIKEYGVQGGRSRLDAEAREQRRTSVYLDNLQGTGVKELAAKYDVSESTVRKDIKTMESRAENTHPC